MGKTKGGTRSFGEFRFVISMKILASGDVMWAIDHPKQSSVGLGLRYTFIQ